MLDVAAEGELTTWSEAPAGTALAYRVTDAIPLHMLGLVPPPPGIGAHLLSSSPIEIAAASAAVTAEAMATLPPAVEPQREVDDDPTLFDPAIAAERRPGLPTPDADEPAPYGRDAGDDEPTFGSAPVPATDGVGADAGDMERPSATAADPGEIDSMEYGEPSTSPAAMESRPLAPTARLSAHGADQPYAGSASRPETAIQAASGGARGGLAALDLSRRGEGMVAHDLTLPRFAVPPGLQPQPASHAPADLAIEDDAEAGVARATGEPATGNWPGFLTGFVMAVAIGVGLYVSLVGS